MVNSIISEFSTTTPVEELAEAIHQELNHVIEAYVPSKQCSNRFNKPWFNSDTKHASRCKARAYRKARRTNRDKDWARFRRLKRDTQKTCRHAYNKYIYNIVHSVPAGSRNKKLGALIKSLRRDQMGVAPLKEGGFLHIDPKSKANVLNRQFTSVFSKDDGSAPPDLGPNNYPAMSSISVSQNGVTKLLRNLKPFTASGPDGIPAKLLKEVAEEISPAITLLLQSSINQGRVPLFADDSVVYKCISSPNDMTSLQKDLDALQDWESKWLMRFNAKKCHVLRITNTGPSKHPKMFMVTP